MASVEQRSLTDRWALVTGAAKRIGAAIVTALHDAGANVALHYFKSSGDAESLAAALNAKRPGSAMVLLLPHLSRKHLPRRRNRRWQRH